MIPDSGKDNAKKSPILPQIFYQNPAAEVARALLGMTLVRLLDGQRISGMIIETEAYQGENDLACHARAGRTKRTGVMYGPPGTAYIYFTYGMHWLLNAVVMPEGFPAAVLIRAIHPLQGIEIIAANRTGQRQKNWTNGPAKICRALQIDGKLNSLPLTSRPGGLWIEHGSPIPDDQIITGPRVGIDSAPEPWKSIPWRYLVREDTPMEHPPFA